MPTGNLGWGEYKLIGAVFVPVFDHLDDMFQTLYSVPWSEIIATVFCI